MRILAIETSGTAGGVALGRDAALVAARELPTTGRRHAQTLASEVGALLTEHGTAPRDLDAVAVSVGPGSFTGLRVGVVFAKTWAYATGCRLIAVDTLRAIAGNAPEDVNDVWVLSDAQRGDVFAARYRRAGESDAFALVEPIELVAADLWLSRRKDGEVCMGPGAVRVARDGSPRLRIPEESRNAPRAEVIARLAAIAFHQGEFADPTTLEPFYLRRPAAEETADARRANRP